VGLDAGQSACVDASAPETAGFDGLLLEGTRLSLPKLLKSAILRLKIAGNLANVG
jgi:hypothetical protein